MQHSSFLGRLAAVSLLTVGLAGASAMAAGTERPYPGITNPSEQRGLNFNVPGVVAKVMVKEGDVVKKGTIVAQQDDSVEQAELLVKEAEAKGSGMQVEAAKADLAQKKVELERTKKMFANKVVGQSDLEKAQLDVVIGDIRVRLADQETNQKQLEVEAQKKKIAQKQLVATIDGIVQKINVHDGELATNDPKTPCMQIVLNEPLSVEVDIPVAVANLLKMGQKVEVAYPNSKGQVAEITFFNPVANAAAASQRVRMQMDNTEHMRSGLQVEVRLQEKVAAAASAR